MLHLVAGWLPRMDGKVAVTIRAISHYGDYSLEVGEEKHP